MTLWPSLSTWQFALAGLVFAGVVLAIHLFNRRRQRVVPWAAMHLLQHAVRRTRRAARLRHWALLLLRMCAVSLFGLALAQPYLSSGGRPFDTTQPVHAVLLIDNSLSMGYETLEGTLLDRAKERARRLVDELPRGSRISVVPVCGSRALGSAEAVSEKERAWQLLERLEVVDRPASIRQAIEAARRAGQGETRLTARWVFFTDRQATTWADLLGGGASPADLMQIVDVSEAETDNSWVAAIRVQDAVADTQTPATILVRVRHRGARPRDAEVTLAVDGRVLASEPVTLNPVDDRELAFTCRFDGEQLHGEFARFAALRASITPDRLPLDDQRHLLVPVFEAIPAVFVDQYGDREAPLAGRVGETRALRQLLAPLSAAETRPAHLRIDQLSRSTLATARLVVIAGVADPGDRVTLLREYVEQGGQLVLAAGGEFDPAAWTRAAWLDGYGILPAPLLAEPLGSLPEQAETLEPFALSLDSLAGQAYFQLAELAPSERRALFAEPLFFKAVQLDRSSGPAGRREDAPLSDTTQGQPTWLRWSSPAEASTGGESVRVLARFSDPQETPFLVQRRCRAGSILLITSGVQSNWNTLPKTNAIILFDRILRSMLHATLPQRNFATQERIALPLSGGSAPDAGVTLIRPGPLAVPETLDLGFVRHNQRGVTLDRPFERGLYRLTAGSDGLSAAMAARSETTQIAVNGDPAESDLQPLDQSSTEQLAASPTLRWIGPDQDLNLSGAQILGQDTWWWLVLLIFLLLLAESCLLLRRTVSSRHWQSQWHTTRPPYARVVGGSPDPHAVSRPPDPPTPGTPHRVGRSGDRPTTSP